MNERMNWSSIKYILCWSICVCVVLGASLYGFHDNKIMSILDDEFGYWVSAALVNTKDWSDVLGDTFYYGYGYSVILAPIMAIVESPVLQYQIALIINAILLVVSEILLYKGMVKQSILAREKLVLISMVAVLYPGYIFYAHTTLSEILLLFCFSLLFYLSMHLEKKFEIVSFIMMIITVWMYTIHSRNIGIIIAFFLCCFLCNNNINKNKIIKWIIFVGVFAGLFFISDCIKQFIIENVYISSEMTEVTATVSMQTGKIAKLFSFEGIKGILINFIGVIWYTLVSTFFLAGLGFYHSYKKIVMYIKQSNVLKIFPYLFICLSYLAEVGITSIYYGPNSVLRIDTMIYGRYSDFVVGALICFGLMEVLESKNTLKRYLYFSLVGILLSLFMIVNLPKDTSHTNLAVNCTGIADIFFRFFNVEATVYISALRSCLIMLVLFICSMAKKMQKVVLVLISVFWIWIAYYSVEDRLLEWKREAINPNIEFYTKFSELRLFDNQVYLLDLLDNRDIKIIQFLLQDCEFTYISEEELSRLKAGSIVFCKKQNDLQYNSDFYFLEDSYEYSAWQKK